MRRLIAVAATVAPVLALSQVPARAVDEIDTKRFRDAVTVGGVLAHERVFQRIANQNGGTRASGTPGYDASAAYVRGRLQQAGYQVTTQPFTFAFYRALAPASLAQVLPAPVTYETSTLTFSGSGSVTGPLVPTNDVQVPPGAEPNSSSSGCEAGDFTPASGTQPQVALIQRGTCTFEVKAANARAAGYDAVVIFNEGQQDRIELVQGTLGRAFELPVVGLSFADGAALHQAAQAGPVTVAVATSTENRQATTTNVIADTPGGDAEKVIVVGAHLDSVVEGPGINDNGSGSATVLEIAEELAEAGVTPRQKVRFAFWGAEELGLVGSEYYVESLSDDALGRIAANLNFDMVGSPNYVRFVYDGDGSTGGPVGPPGSGQIEALFTSYFSGQGLPADPTPFTGRSDYGPFIAVGIPAGGLFSGAEGIKTPAQAATYGGSAGAAYDACYHQACDTMTNLNTKALNELGDGAAHATLTLALTRTGFFEDGSRAAARAPVPSFDDRGHTPVR